MRARWAGLLLGSVGLHAAVLALLTLAAVRAGFPPTIAVDLSAWEHATARRSAGAALPPASDHRGAAGGERAVGPVASDPNARRAPASSRVTSASEPVPSPAETRPVRALAGHEAPAPLAAPLDVSSPAPLATGADSRPAAPAKLATAAAAAGPASSAPGAAATSSAQRGGWGAEHGAAGGGGTGGPPAGRERGTGPAVSGGSQLALAVPGEGRESAPAEYGPYLARFRQRVQDGLVYPLAARRRGLSGAVELDVLIDPGGRVQRVEIASSSSHALLDEAAVDTVKQMTPLPLPATLPARPLRVRLPLLFELR